MAECGPDVIPRDSVELVPISSSLLSSTTVEVATTRSRIPEEGQHSLCVYWKKC